jgi:4-hydroxybenzoate polyprenyltransferase
MAERLAPRARALLDAAVFSSTWVAAGAAALTLASSAAMGVALLPAAAVLAFAGTLCVYNVDRLRDLERDRTTAPARTAFVTRHRRALAGLAGGAAFAGAGAAIRLPPSVWALCSGVLALGLLHRRLKAVPVLKGVYLTASWLAVAVGVPALAAGGAQHVGWVAAVLAAALVANVIASSLRDAESVARWLGPRLSLGTAAGHAALGTALAALAPAAVRPLAAVPLAELAALLAFRPGERYGLAVVDGALLVGACASLTVGFWS